VVAYRKKHFHRFRWVAVMHYYLPPLQEMPLEYSGEGSRGEKAGKIYL